tara:strand:+ start:762 stop:1166 length:405 start_codon:yes stop_codon:yes gene_type:complete
MRDREKKCEEQVDSELERVLTGIKSLRKAMELPDYDDYLDENEYISVLSSDYVDPNTFDDQEEGYYRIQFSWGGPSDELRMYYDGKKYTTIEYWFLDWYDGAFRNVTTDEDILWFVEAYDLPACIETERDDSLA